MAVDYNNTLLATGSCDNSVRVWALTAGAPVAVLQSHNSMITSLQFCPLARGNTRFLLSTGSDSFVCFWRYSLQDKQFMNKPIKFIERLRAGAQMLCSSFSPGGCFVATGSADHTIRLYCFSTPGVPEKIAELEAHTDQVDSIEYAHEKRRFVSGSRHGTARIWRYTCQQWTSVCLPAGEGSGEQVELPRATPRPRVTMVAWSRDDSRVITAVSDHSLKVWTPDTGQLVHTMKFHSDEIFVLECHPLVSSVLLSAGHDGNICLWDTQTGTLVKHVHNNIEGQGHGTVFDAKFSTGGDVIAATDSHGHLLVLGLAPSPKYNKTRKVMDVGKPGRISVEDLIFVIRKDPKKFSRVKELLLMNEELKRARKAFDAVKYE